jgi:hypothetical protein
MVGSIAPCLAVFMEGYLSDAYKAQRYGKRNTYKDLPKKTEISIRRQAGIL